MSLKSARWNSAKYSERSFHEFERLPFTSISLAALNYNPTERVLSLAKPKIRRDTTIKENGKELRLNEIILCSKFIDIFSGFSRYYSDPTYSGVSKAALLAICTERLKELSLPPKRHSSFKYENPIPRPVSHRAMKYQSTERIGELATPKKTTRN